MALVDGRAVTDLVVGLLDGPAHRRLVRRRAPPAVPGRLRAGPADAGDARRSASCSTGSTATSTRWPRSCGSSGVRIAQSPRRGRALDRHRVHRLVARRRRHGRARRRPRARGCAGRPQRIGPARMGEEEAWSDLAAVMEESIHGQDDVRTSLARPYVLRLYARRASRGARPRAGSSASRPPRSPPSPPGAIRAGIAVLVARRRVGAGHRPHRRRPAHRGLAARPGLRRRPSSTSAGWCRSCSTRSAPGGGCSCCGTPPQEPAGGLPPRPTATSRSADLTFRYADAGSDGARPPGPARRQPDRSCRGRSYAVIGRTGSGKSTPGEGAHPGRRRAARHGVPRRHRPASTSTSRGCAAGSPWSRSAPRSWPARSPRTSRCSTRTCCRGRPARWTSWASPPGWPSCPTACRPGSARAATCCPPGQEQLVAFARILVRDPHVVILDEATARMDPVTEARVQRATERLLRRPHRHRHRAPAVLGEPLRRGRRPGRRRGRRGRAAARVAALRPAARAHGQRRPDRRRRGRRLRRRRRTTSEALLEDAIPTRAPGGRTPSAELVVPGEGRPAAAAAAAAGPDAAGDLPARHERPALRARRRRAVHRAGAILGLDGSRPALALGRPGRRRGRPRLWPAVGIVAGAPGDRPDPVLHGRLVPGVVGPPDAADQPAPGARPDRARAGSAATPRPRSSRRAATPSGSCVIADNLVDQIDERGRDRRR